MRSYRAGETIEELCRVCKIDRLHTIIAVNEGGRPIRVQCDYCGSQHNSRSTAAAAGAGESRGDRAARPREDKAPLAVVAAHERAGEPIMMDAPETVDLELL